MLNMPLQIAPQTKLAFTGYALLFLVQVVYVLQHPGMLKVLFPSILMFTIAALVGLYAVNCTVVGGCDLYAWIVGSIIAVFALLTVAFALLFPPK